MKKVKVKVLRSNQKGNAFECSLNNQTFWIQKRSLNKDNEVNDKVITKAIKWVEDFEVEKEQLNQPVSFEQIGETDKAIKATAMLTCTATDQQRKRTYFIPKSILENNKMPAWFADKKRIELNELENYQGSLTVAF